MKLYKESLRRLSRVGFTTLMVAFVATILLQLNLFGNAERWPDSVFTVMPFMRIYVYIAGLLFAFVGFSFLNKRADSDFYHSLPIKRTELYLSVSAAAMTWIAGTVILCTLTSFCMYLFSGVKFVPAYFPLGTLMFIVAAMLVFAAGAIACSLSGTLLTNLALAVAILCLPRLIQFMLARGVVDNTDIIGWLDLNWFLNPATNVATGIAVMSRRAMLAGELIKIGNILYSLLVAVAELALGAWLFKKRPSELAEHGAKNGKWQTAFACCMAMPALLFGLRFTTGYYTRMGNSIFSNLAPMVIISLVCFVTYQLVVMRDGKKVLRSMPWYLCPLALTLVLYAGTSLLTANALSVQPTAEQIKSVSFPDYSYTEPYRNYSVLKVAEIEFTDAETRACTAEALQSAAQYVQKNGPHCGYEELTQFTNVEPIVITLQNGSKVRRSVPFRDVNELNAYREKNDAYAAAIRSFAPSENVTYLFSGDLEPKDEVRKLRDCYNKESAELGLLSSDRFAERKVWVETYRLFTADDDQTFGSFSVSGYDGIKRFHDAFYIKRNMPRTATLYMMLMNTYGIKDSNLKFKDAIDRFDRGTGKDDNCSVNCQFFNVPMQDGSMQQVTVNGYLYRSMPESDVINARRIEMIRQIAELLPNATLTNDPMAFSVRVYYSLNLNNGTEISDPDGTRTSGVFYTFNEADAKKIMTLINEWIVNDYGDMVQYGYVMPAVEGVEAVKPAEGTKPAAVDFQLSPTPMPAPVG